MVKRILFGLLWFVVFYIGACFVTGAIAGGIAGGNDPENAAAAGAEAGARAVAPLRSYFLVGSALLAGAGSWSAVLPGTRGKRARKLTA